jgi:hypothetical protein
MRSRDHLCAGGVKLQGNKRCPVCDAGPGDNCAKAALRDFEERQALVKALTEIATIEAGSRSAYGKFARAQIIASEALAKVQP